MTRRTDQIASTIQRALEEVIARGLSDPRVQGLISVTKVDVTPDLKTAQVMISVYPHEKAELTLHGLKAASAYIRREVSNRVSLSRVPAFVFKVDQTTWKHAKALEAISKATEDLAKRRGVAEGAAPDQEEDNGASRGDQP